MKNLIIVTLLLLSLTAKSQISDSLAKYTYPFIGMTEPYYMFYGSCFFVKDKGCLYLVSAKHCFTGCDHGKQYPHYPSSMSIYIPKIKKRISVNTAFIQYTNPCKTHTATDFAIIKINAADSQFLNTVESFIKPPFKKVKTISIYGYPGIMYNNFNFFVPAEKMSFSDKIYGFGIRKDSIEDFSGCYFNVDNFMKDYDSIGGFSGSPVFVQEKKTKQWRIAGVFTGNAPNLDTGKCGLFYVYMELIMKQIALVN